MSSPVFCLHPSYPYLKPKRVGIQIPLAIPSKLFTCPFLSANWTQLLYLSGKALFTISSHCLQARSFRGPSTLCAPYRLLSNYHAPYSFSSIDFNTTLNSTLHPQLNPLASPQPSTQPSTQPPTQHGADNKPKTASETDYFYKKTKLFKLCLF